jgi:hypothetical protein
LISPSERSVTRASISSKMSMPEFENHHTHR